MIYNLEYQLMDSIGRGKKPLHVGVFASLDEVENAKQNLIKQFNPYPVNFNVYIIENLFSKVSNS